MRPRFGKFPPMLHPSGGGGRTRHLIIKSSYRNLFRWKMNSTGRNPFKSNFYTCWRVGIADKFRVLDLFPISGIFSVLAAFRTMSRNYRLKEVNQRPRTLYNTGKEENLHATFSQFIRISIENRCRNSFVIVWFALYLMCKNLLTW